MELQIVGRSSRPPLLIQEGQERYGLGGGDDSRSATWKDGDDLRWAVRHWAARLNVKSPQVQIRAMTTKWALISSRGRLTLNAELLGLPRGLGEYGVLHELVHLLIPNHGLVFKLFFDAYMPDWREREAVLRGV